MTQVSGPVFSNDGNIDNRTELLIRFSEQFSHPPLESVPANGVAYFFADSQAQSRVLLSGVNDHNEMGCVITLSCLPDPLVFARPTDPVESGEGLRTFHPVIQNYLVVIVAAKRLRPLARRRLITLAPPLVRIRLRKPWVRLRLIRLG